MEDRELLELAARALGWSVRFQNFGHEYEQPWAHAPHQPANHEFKWNPLHDNGDALQLAVKLQIDLSFFDSELEAIWYARVDGVTRRLRVSETGGDGCVRTRRAIVRAAAEIGKSLEKNDEKA